MHRHLFNPSQRVTALLAFVATALLAASASLAQWNPASGQWGKTDPSDVRVMTWNVNDAICSTNAKQEAVNNWSGVAVIIAAMQPDILLLQETGDNVGNGTGSFADPANWVEATIEVLFTGGDDPFNPGQEVTAYVQKYAPGYELPYIYVSTESDGFNRNAIVSRWPFADLNGDGKATMSDIPFLNPDEYAPGGNGGIRGFMFVEIDLPDDVYDGDLVVGNAHLKAGGSASDQQARRTAARNVAYFIDYFYNGAGVGVPNPNGAINASPPPTSILAAPTPIIMGGDWNEDELTNNSKGPADWLVNAEFVCGDDGTDRDRSDSTFDSATDVFTGQRGTFGASSKLDYIAWQDSIAQIRRAWIFNTSPLDQTTMPPEVLAFPGFGNFLSSAASDHRPVIADFIFPQATCAADLNGDGVVDGADLASLLSNWGAEGGPADLNGDDVVDGADLAIMLSQWGAC